MLNTDNSLKITEAIPKGASYPLLLNFQNNMDANFSIQVEKCELTAGKAGQTANVFANNMQYEGAEDPNPLVRNLILVRNKRTGDVRLLEAGRVAMKAKIAEKLCQIDYSLQEIGEKFGSKRHQRSLQQSKKMKVDIDAVKEQLTTSLMKVDIDVADLAKQEIVNESTNEKYLPPMNRNASDPKDVFKLEKILSIEQLEALRAIATSSDNTTVSTSYIKKLMSIETCDTNSRCALLYADCLIKFLNDHYKTVCSKGYKACSYSDVISDMILKNFCTMSNKGRTRPQSMKDKALGYILVLILISCDCSIPKLDELCKVLKLSMVKMSQMVKVVGAHVRTSGGVTSVVLTLPLANPPSLKARRDKK